jgi:alkanesulfonate monooxygenase SsuD/methylene tetrahydromethanopterin reductase-like flavin-dependent oxidoreductase (luciferase family)
VTAQLLMPAPRMCLILSENWTMTSGRDLPTLVRWAREAEDAGFDSVMISEHIVLGPSAGAPRSPRGSGLWPAR